MELWELWELWELLGLWELLELFGTTARANGQFRAFACGACTYLPDYLLLMLMGTRHVHGKMLPQPGGSTPSISTTTLTKIFTSRAHVEAWELGKLLEHSKALLRAPAR